MLADSSNKFCNTYMYAYNELCRGENLANPIDLPKMQYLRYNFALLIFLRRYYDYMLLLKIYSSLLKVSTDYKSTEINHI